MPDLDEEELKTSEAGSLLGPSMFYISGRIDAADRKLTLISGGGLAFAAYQMDAFKLQIEELHPDCTILLIYAFSLLSIFLSGVSALVAGWGLFPKKVSGNDWLSRIFLQEASADRIADDFSSSGKGAIAEFIQAQINLSTLVTKKNALFKFAFLSFSASIALFGIVQILLTY